MPERCAFAEKDYGVKILKPFCQRIGIGQVIVENSYVDPIQFCEAGQAG